MAVLIDVISPGRLGGAATMGALTWILVGLFAGWLAARITGSKTSVLGDLVIGLAGSIFGGLLFTNPCGAGFLG
jgi:uncharacterized membrane protein YeaQ/YmgE (transglycosylase-associated protein family)